MRKIGDKAHLEELQDSTYGKYLSQFISLLELEMGEYLITSYITLST